MSYDVTDLRPKILTFALNSTNQADYCIKLINDMKFKSDEVEQTNEEYNSEELVFFDVEVFPNLFIVAYKKRNGKMVKLINPSSQDMEPLMRMLLVGYNCRRYDNHIIYARYIGYTLMELFTLSQRIINNSKNALFSEAYNLSYTDVYEFSTIKQSLKKWEIQLNIKHKRIRYSLGPTSTRTFVDNSSRLLWR